MHISVYSDFTKIALVTRNVKKTIVWIKQIQHLSMAFLEEQHMSHDKCGFCFNHTIVFFTL